MWEMGFNIRKRGTGTRIYKIDYTQQTRDRTWRQRAPHGTYERRDSTVSVLGWCRGPGLTAVSGWADLVFRLLHWRQRASVCGFGPLRCVEDAGHPVSSGKPEPELGTSAAAPHTPPPPRGPPFTSLPPVSLSPSLRDDDTSRGRNQLSTPQVGCLRVGTVHSSAVDGCGRMLAYAGVRHRRDVGEFRWASVRSSVLEVRNVLHLARSAGTTPSRRIPSQSGRYFLKITSKHHGALVADDQSVFSSPAANP